MGADAIELDVHLTADGVAVVHHDATVGPPGKGQVRAPIARLSKQALDRYPLAAGIRIPLLSEVLSLVGDRAAVYVEAKAAGAEDEVVRCIMTSSTSCAVHGFDHRVSLRAATVSPTLPTGILLTSYLVDPASALRNARARDYWQQWEMIDRDLVAQIHEAGGRVIAWTVNDRDTARRLRMLGVDAICTDICGSLTSF